MKYLALGFSVLLLNAMPFCVSAEQTSEHYIVDHGSVSGGAASDAQSASYRTNGIVGEGATGGNSSVSYTASAGFNASTSLVTTAPSSNDSSNSSSGGGNSGSGSTPGVSYGLFGRVIESIVSAFTSEPATTTSIVEASLVPSLSPPVVVIETPLYVVPVPPIPPTPGVSGGANGSAAVKATSSPPVPSRANIFFKEKTSLVHYLQTHVETVASQIRKADSWIRREVRQIAVWVSSFWSGSLQIKL